MMKFLVLIVISSLTILFSCQLPSGKIPIIIKYDKKNVSSRYYSNIIQKLESKGFNMVYGNNNKVPVVFFSELESGHWAFSDKVASFSIYSSKKVAPININMVVKSEDILRPSDSKLNNKVEKFTEKVTNKIKEIITVDQCIKFQLFFDKQIAIEKQQSQQNLQQRALGNAKEEKRRQALAKLAQEENYEKLKKVLKIKPEYRTLLDDRTKTMLIGTFTLGEMSKSLRSGISDSQMISKLESTSFTYSSSFTFKQRNHLQEAGLSNKLIDYLELHTQEIEIQREQERRLTRLERQREREIEEAQEAREEERRSARRARERQEENDADRSRSEAFSSWQRDFQAGLDRDMNSINKNSNQFIKQYNEAQRTPRPSSSTINYNSSRSPTYKSNYSNSYSSDVREIKSSSNKELDEIRAKKMRVVAQKEEVKPKKSGKVYKTYTDTVEDSFSSHNRKSAELNVKSGLKAKANDFCRNNGWEFADTKGNSPFISGCEDVNGEVKCNGRLEFGCYKYEY